MSRRPNILFLMSDEHRADVTGYEGNDVISTPFLDFLADSGVSFRNAYTPSPICVPGRQCMMSGKLPKSCGCEGWIDLQADSMTFARRFAQYAYETVCCGKLHHLGVDQMQGWTQRPAGLGDIINGQVPGRLKEEVERYARPFKDFKWSDAKEIQRAGAGVSQIMRRDQHSLDGALLFADEWFASPWYDREMLRQPLFLKLSLIQPHYPYGTDEERFRYYLNRVEPFLNQQVADHPFLSQRQVRPGIDASEREIRRATAAYYGMIETVDSHFLKLFDRLEDLGQDLDDWIIIYTSDHGEMLGEHGIWEKQKFYEGSVRVPLIIRWPNNLDCDVIYENVNLCDLFATLCDLCDLPIPEGLDSRSLVPLMEGRASDWNNETLSQFGATNYMIKQDALKYQYYGEDMPEVLFDLDADPRELHNCIDDPAYATALSRFRRRLAELGHGPEAQPAPNGAGYKP